MNKKIATALIALILTASTAVNIAPIHAAAAKEGTVYDPNTGGISRIGVGPNYSSIEEYCAKNGYELIPDGTDSIAFKIAHPNAHREAIPELHFNPEATDGTGYGDIKFKDTYAAKVLSGEAVHLYTMSDGAQFDPYYYYAAYPDVVAACGSNVLELYGHYVKSGKAEGRLPYYIASAAADKAAATAASTKAAIEAAEQTTEAQMQRAKAILNDYLSGKQYWEDSMAGKNYTVSGGRGYSKAGNPAFAIADLNGDGALELYTTPNCGAQLELIVIHKVGTKQEDTIRWIYGYNPSLNKYMRLYQNGYLIETLDNIEFSVEKDASSATGWSYYTWGVGKEISAADAAAYKATYLPLSSSITFQPLTKANVNAIQ